MTDLAARVEKAQGDHDRGCQGRCYSCSCGYDEAKDALIRDLWSRVQELEQINGGGRLDAEGSRAGSPPLIQREARKNEARYLWLRTWEGQWIVVREEPENVQLSGDELDIAIDAAMRAAEET